MVQIGAACALVQVIDILSAEEEAPGDLFFDLSESDVPRIRVGLRALCASR
jgi:hypothetical protein